MYVKLWWWLWKVSKEEEEVEKKLGEAASFCPDMSMVWEWIDVAGLWHRYDLAICLTLESAHNMGMIKLQLVIGGIPTLFWLQARRPRMPSTPILGLTPCLLRGGSRWTWLTEAHRSSGAASPRSPSR